MVKVEPKPIKDFHWQDIIVASRGNETRYYFVGMGETSHDYNLIDLDKGSYLCSGGDKGHVIKNLNELYDSYKLLKKGRDYIDLIIR